MNSRYRFRFFYNICIFTVIFAFSHFFLSCSYWEVKKSPLGTPENLRVENVTDFSAIVRWDYVDSADEYSVEIKCLTGEYSWSTYWVEKPEYVFDDLMWEETYEVTVYAVSSNKEAFWCKYTDGKPKKISFSTKERMFPSVPEGEIDYVRKIDVVQNDDNSFTFSWEKVEDADFYDLICEHFPENEDVSSYSYFTLNASELSYTDIDVGDADRVRYSIC